MLHPEGGGGAGPAKARVGRPWLHGFSLSPLCSVNWGRVLMGMDKQTCQQASGNPGDKSAWVGLGVSREALAGQLRECRSVIGKRLVSLLQV